MERLEDQLAWYEQKAKHHKRWFQSLKVGQIVVAAAIPAVAAAGASAGFAGALGAVVVVMEGLQQLFQFQQNWIAYRGTAEALKHEKYLYLARADAYAHSRNPLRLLAERIEGLISQEHARWISSRRNRDDEEGKDESEEPEA